MSNVRSSFRTLAAKVRFRPIADIGGGCDIQAVFGSILLLMAAPASAPLGVFERMTAQEAAKRFTQCGLGPVTIRWNDPDTGGEDILVATGVKSATDEQLRCADKAVGYYTLELPQEM